MSNQGKVWWNELGTRDVAGSKAFYGKVVGWTFEEMAMGDGNKYNIYLHPQGPAGGIFKMDGPQFDGVPQHWMAFFAVDDVAATCETVKANNGSIPPGTFRRAERGQDCACFRPLRRSLRPDHPGGRNHGAAVEAKRSVPLLVRSEQSRISGRCGVVLRTKCRIGGLR